MSRPLRAPGELPDTFGAQKGSVRAARERLQAGQTIQENNTSDRNRAVPPGQPILVIPHYSPKADGRSRHAPNPINVPINNSPAWTTSLSDPQWPMNGEVRDDSIQDSYRHERATDRGPPPPRPPRPTYVPSILDPTQSKTPPPVQTASSPERGPWQGNSFLSPASTPSNSSRPLTTSSQASTNSSLGSIPDFPVPAPIMQPPRRSPNLGPPPSARRGPSSYYTHPSYVSPIVEETESRKSRGSYASSTVIPSGAKDFYTDNASISDHEEPTGSDDGQSSTNTNQDEKSGLVRKASLGKRHKPSLTTIKSGDNLQDDKATLGSQRQDPKKGGIVSQAAIAAGAAGGAFAVGLGTSKDVTPRADSSLSSGTGLLDPSSSSSSSISEKSLEKSLSKEMLANPPSSNSKPRSRAPQPSQGDPRVDRILGGLEKGGAIDATTANTLKPIKQSNLAGRVGKKRPPELNVEAVREAEARGSLTSLPDLIKRATRLAANLDRGKTASRLGVEWFNSDSVERHELEADYRRSAGSLSEILASFPPPGLATPTNDGATMRSTSRLPSNLAYGQNPLEQDYQNMKDRPRGRRCCGLPLWLFMLVLILLFLCIAAAVILPVVLVVLPKHNGSNSSGTSSALAACRQRSACQNGGSEILTTDGSCGCVCANGYTGERCTISSDQGCTMIDTPGASHATVGSAIPRLLDGARTNFSIPLDTSTLLSVFSSTNISCAAENALVMFNGLAARSVDTPNLPLLDPIVPSPLAPETQRPPTVTDPPRLLLDRQVYPPSLPSSSVNDPGAAHTSNGIVFAGSPSPTPTRTQTVTIAPNPAQSQPASSSSGASPGTNATSLDFARIGVLFVLQESRALDAAVAAQERLQDFFADAAAAAAAAGSGADGGGDAADARDVSLGGGYEIDLVGLTVRVANGTVFGGG